MTQCIEKGLFCFFLFSQFSLVGQNVRCYENKKPNYQTQILVDKKHIFIENKTSYAAFHSFGKIKNKRIIYSIDSTFQICYWTSSKRNIKSKDSIVVEIELIASDYREKEQIILNRNEKDEKELTFSSILIKDNKLVFESDFLKLKEKNKIIYRYTSDRKIKVKNIHGKKTNKNHNYFYAKIYFANSQLWEGYSGSLNDRVFLKKNQAFLWNDLLKKELILKDCECSNSIMKLKNETEHLIF